MTKLTYSIVLALSLFLLMMGCKAKTVYVPVESVKTEYRDRLERDSIYLHDSIFVERWRSNDTVFVTKEKYKYLYRNKLVRDTICKTDSIAVPYLYPVPGPEVNILSSFQSFQIWCGRILLGLLLGYGAVRFIRKKFS